MGNEDSLDPLLRRTAIPAGGAAGECLDAETLAAFTDGTLPPGRRAAAESHAADCERCLALVAAMARTNPDPMPGSDRAGWFTWRWILPLATATAALLLVLAAQRESNPVQDVTSPNARLEPAPAPPRADAPVEERRAPEAAASGSTSRKTASAARQERQQQPAPGPSGPIAAAAPVMKDQAAATPAPAAELAPAAPPAPADSSASARARGVAATVQSSSDAPARAEALDEIRQSRGRSGFTAPVEVMAPDPAVRWRVVGPVVSRSIDGGVTWREQFTGSGGELLAGAAPSDRVCWLAGRSGVVLRTRDGQSWRPLKSPTTSDLTAVSAIDEDTATVTTADGRRYRTTNGGLTWVLQENPPAPF